MWITIVIIGVLLGLGIALVNGSSVSGGLGLGLQRAVEFGLVPLAVCAMAAWFYGV